MTRESLLKEKGLEAKADSIAVILSGTRVALVEKDRIALSDLGKEVYPGFRVGHIVGHVAKSGERLIRTLSTTVYEGSPASKVLIEGSSEPYVQRFSRTKGLTMATPSLIPEGLTIPEGVLIHNFTLGAKLAAKPAPSPVVGAQGMSLSDLDKFVEDTGVEWKAAPAESPKPKPSPFPAQTEPAKDKNGITLVEGDSLLWFGRFKAKYAGSGVVVGDDAFHYILLENGQRELVSASALERI